MDKKIKYLIDKLSEHNFDVFYHKHETYRKDKLETVHCLEQWNENKEVIDSFEETDTNRVMNRLINTLAAVRVDK